MTTIEQHYDPLVPSPTSSGVRWRVGTIRGQGPTHEPPGGGPQPLVARRADMTTTFGQATVEMSATRRIRATMTMAAARPATQPLLIRGELRHG